jgi:hypothetical protein
MALSLIEIHFATVLLAPRRLASLSKMKGM